MPEIYADDNGNRVLIRHSGPAGKGFPVGGTTGQILVKTSGANYIAGWANPPSGTGAAVGPSAAVDGNFAIFDGVTGKLIKDSGRNLAYFASRSYSDEQFVAKITGFGLSSNDFTSEEKIKLATIVGTSGYRGTFSSVAQLTAYAFDPPPVEGDYCTIEVVDSPVHIVLWDATNVNWDAQEAVTSLTTGQEVADVLFAGTTTWSKADCEIYTSGDKEQLALLAQASSGVSALKVIAVTAATTPTGANHQLKVELNGVNYWIPMKSSEWS